MLSLVRKRNGYRLGISAKLWLQVTMQTVDHWYFSVVKRSARRQSAVQNGSEIVFPPCWQMKAVVLFIVATYGSLFFALISSKPVLGDPWYLKPVLISILAALPMPILLPLPGPVVTASSAFNHLYRMRPNNYI